MGAFFVVAALGAQNLWRPAPADGPTAAAGVASAACPATHAADDTGVVEHIVDGDTLRLRDGRTIRLLGINTPELGRDGQPSQPFAIAAHKRLAQLAPPGQTLTLHYDVELEDRYGRTLAGLKLADGTDIQAELLHAGLATMLVVPPNLRHTACYTAIEREAMAAGTGIWSHPQYAIVEAASLPANASGYHRVRGRVQHVGRGRSALWLNLEPDGVAIRIRHQDLQYFNSYNPGSLAGVRVVVRGWLHRGDHGLWIQVRHPYALEISDH